MDHPREWVSVYVSAMAPDRVPAVWVGGAQYTYFWLAELLHVIVNGISLMRLARLVQITRDVSLESQFTYWSYTGSGSSSAIVVVVVVVVVVDDDDDDDEDDDDDFIRIHQNSARVL